MREINRILCPVDLSDVSDHAIAHAVLIASWYKSRITALHVLNPALVPGTEFALVGGDPATVLSQDEIAAVREQVARRFETAAAVDVDVLVRTGSAAHQIVERARSLPADLIVIGTHGVGGFQHLVLGSVTEKVLRQALCPVLTVPPHALATSSLPFKRLLCPVDFSDSSLAALDLALSLAREGDAQLTILHVLEWMAGSDPSMTRPFNPEYVQQSEQEVTRKMQELVPQSMREWFHPTTRIAHGKAYREILAIATEERSDLIVMGVHGRNALDLMLFGSTTNQLVRRATCPVLTLRD
jgi:nucleotide-binding universal stress UspA family protein